MFEIQEKIHSKAVELKLPKLAEYMETGEFQEDLIYPDSELGIYGELPNGIDILFHYRWRYNQREIIYLMSWDGIDHWYELSIYEVEEVIKNPSNELIERIGVIANDD